MIPKLSNLKIVMGYWNENSDSCFCFNNSKQCSNWIILVSFCSSHLAIKIATMLILKKWCKNWFFCKNSKKVCVLQRRACNKFKRNYLENYNDSEHAVKIKMKAFGVHLRDNISRFRTWKIFFSRARQNLANIKVGCSKQFLKPFPTKFSKTENSFRSLEGVLPPFLSHFRYLKRV